MRYYCNGTTIAQFIFVLVIDGREEAKLCVDANGWLTSLRVEYRNKLMLMQYVQYYN